MTNLTIGKTILEHLGGSRFTAMTGAHSFTTDGNSLTFKLPRSEFNTKKFAGCKVTLNGKDLYDIEFFKFTRSRDGLLSCKMVEKSEDLYNDMLEEAFTDHTGLMTSLKGR